MLLLLWKVGHFNLSEGEGLGFVWDFFNGFAQDFFEALGTVIEKFAVTRLGKGGFT